MFAGIGYDVHKFKKARPLFLGGIKIEYPYGLDGHSDADVLIHALMDALLGACGLEDIGHLFPNNDKKFKNISSIKLLNEVAKAIASKKYKIQNVDVTLICEAPKIAPYINSMKEQISLSLKIKKERVGIKATTNEGMGFIGRKEGIAAFAVASVKKGK